MHRDFRLHHSARLFHKPHMSAQRFPGTHLLLVWHMFGLHRTPPAGFSGKPDDFETPLHWPHVALPMSERSQHMRGTSSRNGDCNAMSSSSSSSTHNRGTGSNGSRKGLVAILKLALNRRCRLSRLLKSALSHPLA